MGWPQVIILVYYILQIIFAFILDGKSVRVRFWTQLITFTLVLIVLNIGGFFAN